MLKYLITEARKINNNILIIAQLPDMNIETEVKYVNNVGVNLFVKEMIWCTDQFEILEIVTPKINNKSKYKRLLIRRKK